MATLSAGNSVSQVVAADQTVTITVNHNNAGRIRFVPTGAEQQAAETGVGASFGPLAMSKTFGPWNQPGTVFLFADVGTVTYTINDSYIPGNLGIGTTLPAAKLEIRGNTTAVINADAIISRTGAGNFGVGQGASIQLQNATDSSYVVLQQNANAFQVWNYTGSVWNERMRIDSSGSLFVGKTAANVGVDGAQFLTTGFSGVSAAGTTAFFLNRNTNDGTILEFGRNGVSAASMGLTSSALTIGTAGTTRMQIDANGNISGTAGTTSMTNGFFYIPGAAGAPSGTPTAISGTFPMYYDSTNNRFYVYNGAWKSVVLA